MKKNILYALALATTMVACTDDYTDWAAPQENGPEDAKSVSVSVSAASAIDFATSTAENVTIFSPSFTAEDGATATYKVTLSPEDNSASAVLNSADGTVPAEELKNAVISFYGKAPTPRILNAVVDAYVDVKGQTIKVTAPAVAVNVTLDAPFISTGYYLIGDMNGWNGDNMFAFKHSGANVYDDPVFTLVFTTEADGQYWKIIPQSNVDASNVWNEGIEGVVGVEVDGDTSLEGLLTTTAPQAGKIEKAGMYKMTLNMMDYTYKLEELNFEEYIYIPGNHQGWSPATAPRLYGANFDGYYSGFSCLDGGFKFTKGPDWAFGEYNWGSFTSHPEGFTGEGGGDITCTVKDFYFIEANVAEGTLKATPTTWGIIGDATANGWDSDQDMTWNAEKHCWCATITLTDGTIKFRANDGWDINFGGNPDNLSAGGADIPVTAGTYDIDLYLERTTSENIYCTMTKK